MRKDELRVCGLGHKVIGAHREAHELVKLGGAAGEHHDGGVAPLPEGTRHILAVGPGKAQVKHHGIGQGGGDVLDQVVKAGGTLDVVTSV